MATTAQTQPQPNLTVGDDNMEISSDAGHTAGEEDLIDIDIDFEEQDTKDENMDDSEQTDGQTNADDDLMYDDGDAGKDETANEEDMVDYSEDEDEELDDAQGDRQQEQVAGSADDLVGTAGRPIDDDDVGIHPPTAGNAVLEDSPHKNEEQADESILEEIDTANLQEAKYSKPEDPPRIDMQYGSTVAEEAPASQEQKPQIPAPVEDAYTASAHNHTEQEEIGTLEHDQNISEDTATSGLEVTNNTLQPEAPTDDYGSSNHAQEPPLLKFSWRDSTIDPFRPEDDTSFMTLEYPVASENLQTFLSICRQHLQGEIDEDCELELQFEQIDLCFRESDEDATPSLFDVNDIYVNLTSEVEPLRLTLVERPTFTARWSELNDLVASGGTLQDANPSAYGFSDADYHVQNDESAKSEEPDVPTVSSQDVATKHSKTSKFYSTDGNDVREESATAAKEGTLSAQQLKHDSNAEQEHLATEAQLDFLNESVGADEGGANAYDLSQHGTEQLDGQEAGGVATYAPDEPAQEHDFDEFEDEKRNSDQPDDQVSEQAAENHVEATDSSAQRNLIGSHDDSANDGASRDELASFPDDDIPEHPANALPGGPGLVEPLPDETEEEVQDDFVEPGTNEDAHGTEESTEYFDASASYDADGNESSQPLEGGPAAELLHEEPNTDPLDAETENRQPHDDQQDLFDDDEIHLDLPEDDEAFDNKTSPNGQETTTAASGEGDSVDLFQDAEPILGHTSAPDPSSQLHILDTNSPNGVLANAVAGTLSRKRSQSDNAPQAGGDAKKSRPS